MMIEDEVDVTKRVKRLKEIGETLEGEEVDLSTAKELREEADTHLAELRDALDVSDGDIIEIDGAEAEIRS